MKLKKEQLFNFLLPLLVIVVLISVAAFLLLRQKSQSRVYLSLDNQTLKVNFQVSPSDRAEVDDLNNRLGLDPNWTKGLTVSLDASSAGYLRSELPTTLIVSFNPGLIRFHSPNRQLLLQNSQPGTEYHFASSSGSLDFKKIDQMSFSLLIHDPAVVITEASHSGSLYLSDRLQPLWPILQKVATIDLKVLGKNINGEIKLK